MKAIKVGGDPDMPADENTAIDVSTDLGKKQQAAVRRNALAMASLMMAFSNEGTMGLVYKAMSVQWTGGLACLVVGALFKKYQPQDTITRVELRQMLNKVSMKKKEDPAILFEQLSSIQNLSLIHI